MKITIRHDEQVTILDLVGNLTIGVGDVTLRRAVNEELKRGVAALVLNFQKVKWIDSAGIGELVECQNVAARNGAVIKLLNLNKKNAGVLAMSNLIGRFAIFDDEIEAVASFRDSAATPAPPVPRPSEDSEVAHPPKDVPVTSAKGKDQAVRKPKNVPVTHAGDKNHKQARPPASKNDDYDLEMEASEAWEPW